MTQDVWHLVVLAYVIYVHDCLWPAVLPAILPPKHIVNVLPAAFATPAPYSQADH